jgi:hypothetical protein
VRGGILVVSMSDEKSRRSRTSKEYSVKEYNVEREIQRQLEVIQGLVQAV